VTQKLFSVIIKELLVLINGENKYLAAAVSLKRKQHLYFSAASYCPDKKTTSLQLNQNIACKYISIQPCSPNLPQITQLLRAETLEV